MSIEVYCKIMPGIKTKTEDKRVYLPHKYCINNKFITNIQQKINIKNKQENIEYVK